MKNNPEAAYWMQTHKKQRFRWRLCKGKGLLLLLIFLVGTLRSIAQDVRIGGSEPVKNTQREAPVSKPAPPRQQAYGNISILPDEDCILTIDGTRQRDTLRAGKAIVRSLAVGTHRLSAESVSTGYLLNQQVKVDAGRRNTVEIGLDEAFQAHMKRVETALLQQH